MKATRVFSILKKEYPQATIRLRYGTTMQLLAATIMSAQCTDKRVNLVTEKLFKKYRTVRDFASADRRVFEKEIRSTGFYRQKAKNIIAGAGKILADFSGRVPDTMEGLLTLPGVGRKTANIVLTCGYGIVHGIAVDTHVRRVAGRLGFSASDDPVKIERDLMKLFPKKDWESINHVLIEHGRKVCHAGRPECPVCVVRAVCPAFLTGVL